MTEHGNIIEKLAAIMTELGAVPKSGVNAQQKYRFRQMDDIAAKLQPLLGRHQVIILPKVLEFSTSERTSQSGTIMTHMTALIQFTFESSDGSCVLAQTLGESLDASDKAANKCMTAALKYALTQVLCIPSHEIESDADSPEMPPAQHIAPRPPAPPELAAVSAEDWMALKKMAGENGWLPSYVHSWIKDGRANGLLDSEIYGDAKSKFSEKAPGQEAAIK